MSGFRECSNEPSVFMKAENFTVMYYSNPFMLYLNLVMSSSRSQCIYVQFSIIYSYVLRDNGAC